MRPILRDKIPAQEILIQAFSSPDREGSTIDLSARGWVVRIDPTQLINKASGGRIHLSREVYRKGAELIAANRTAMVEMFRRGTGEGVCIKKRPESTYRTGIRIVALARRRRAA